MSVERDVSQPVFHGKPASPETLSTLVESLRGPKACPHCGTDMVWRKKPGRWVCNPCHAKYQRDWAAEQKAQREAEKAELAALRAKLSQQGHHNGQKG